MKLLFYSPVDLRAGLGCERWHCDVTNSLKTNHGAEVEIVTGNIGILRWTTEYMYSQLQKIPYRKLNFPILFSSILPDPFSFWTLFKKIRQVDVVHFISGFVGQDIMLATLKVLTGKRIIVGHHAPIFHSSKFHNWYMVTISRHVLKLFEAHMVLNADDKVILESWGLKNVHFIPSGIRVEKFLSQKRHTNPAHLNFLLNGRYDTPQKGFDLAVQAIALFNDHQPQSKAIFSFLGSGHPGSIVEQYAAKYKNIVNLGFRKYEELPQIYAGSDIFLLSSREEPFGLILIEAWSSGIPVLATKTQGPLDMLVPNKNGWFIEAITVEAIAKAISRIYSLWQNHPGSFSKMESACRKTGKAYSIDQTARKMYTQLFH